VKTYLVKKQQAIPISVNEAWEFFSTPSNLAKITPEEMNFVLTSGENPETKMYPGMIITYKITPVFGIKLNWMTEIAHVMQGEYFIDEQRVGPYALWHHEHHFKAIKGGVLMSDILHYAIPYGAIGRLANAIFVEKQIKKIFDYREKAIVELFGKL
jgi:ligand-binding SRPBCC domain-containing protein